MTCQAWVLPYKVRNDAKGAVFDVKRLRISLGNCLKRHNQHFFQILFQGSVKNDVNETNITSKSSLLSQNFRFHNFFKCVIFSIDKANGRDKF